MIPRHRPPFSIAALAGAAIPGFGLRRVEQLEHAYANVLDAPFAIWLPSARYGIFQAIRFGLRLDDQVYCPAFTCGVVHQAIRQTARSMSLVDCKVDSPLMDLDRIRNSSGYGVVLSEVFGHRYLNSEANSFVFNARLRIFDMAMCIPTASDMKRLVERDVALISFGLGKSLYAGWGGMAFTKDSRMAELLRNARNQDVQANSFAARIRNIASVCLRTIAHSKSLYNLSRRAANRRSESIAVSAVDQTSPAVPQKLQSQEWRQSSTQFHLNLAIGNLNRSDQFAQDRLAYSRIYRKELTQLSLNVKGGDSAWLTLLPDCEDAMSHFGIRIHGTDRDELRTLLWRHGIDTATLFPFPSGTDAIQLPNAFRLTKEILGLPLSNGLGEHNIRRVCSLIERFAATTPRSSTTPAMLQVDRHAA